MRKLIFIFLLCVRLVADEAIDKKSGITLTVTGTAGIDYVVEYTYHNPGVFDLPTIYVKDTTSFAFAHNSRNVASVTGRPKQVVGTGASKGQIRFVFDHDWSRKSWSASSGTPFPLYSAPFSFSSLNSNYFGSGQNLIGGTGGNGATITDRNNYFWKGTLDAVGDEWHVLKYADDDYVDFPSASGDATASDGKWVLVVVNPLTPALSIAATDATGQFYTTPAKAYLMPKINDQTTYFQGNCTITLTNINGANVSYDLNGGSTVNVGAATVALTQAAFASGSNTLRYWYTATPSIKRTRTVVKNPAFVSGETHGDLLWGASGLATVTARIARAPYASVYANFSNKNSYFTGQSDWLSYNQGVRLGGQVAAVAAGPASNNAFQARVLGNSASASGASLTYAEYAKQMMLDSGLTTPDLGMEKPWASDPQASSEVNYRGYWDYGLVASVAVAYDWAAAYFRSDQHASGMTPVEERFVRDRLAQWLHKCGLVLGDYTEQGAPGMWGSSWNVGAMMAALVIPTYSSAYYGTNGIDGNTTTYTYAPYSTTNYTWKQLFLEHSYSLGTYPAAPVHRFGLEGSNDDTSLANFSGDWTDRRAYAGDGQMGAVITIYRNLQKMYSPATSHTYLDSYLDRVTRGVAMYYKAESGDVPPPPFGPFRWSAVGLLNSNFPTLVTNSRSYAQGLSSGDENSDDSGISNLSLYAFAWYDDGAGSGGDTTPPTPNPATISGPPTHTSTTITVTATTATDETSLGSAPYRFSSDNGSTWTSYQSSASYTFTALAPSTSYNIRVQYQDAAANAGTASAASSVTTDAVVTTPVASRQHSGIGVGF